MDLNGGNDSVVSRYGSTRAAHPGFAGVLAGHDVSTPIPTPPTLPEKLDELSHLVKVRVS